ncbi:protein Aster-A isoform X1 [Alligator mississippiensis]|uniref:protein Aster-A isoform X1 n=1 Tax=Alligator mississippiensis TaxID=8496 RepID=UPI002877A5FE|nr:protein Aster-A isoform X1 [Alligator mississippiensis]
MDNFRALLGSGAWAGTAGGGPDRAAGPGLGSPRGSPSSSPALRRRLPLLPPRPPPEPPAEPRGSDAAPAAATLYYPLAGRSFIRNHKRVQSWYSVLSPTYKQRNEDFHRIFKGLHEAERLLVDYSCALQRDILLQGRLYLSETRLCFYSNIFRWETAISIPLKEVTHLRKEKTAKLIPNAILICTKAEKHFFTSFGARDRCFDLIHGLWINAQLGKTLSPRELRRILHQGYGAELGLTSEDDDYVAPTLGSAKEGDDPELSDPQPDASPEPGPQGAGHYHSPPSPASSSDGTISVVEDVEDPAVGAAEQTVTLVQDPPKPEGPGDTPLPTPAPSLGDAAPSEELPTDVSRSCSSCASSSSTHDEGDGPPGHSLLGPAALPELGREPRTPGPRSEPVPAAEVDSFFSDLPGRLLINAVYHVGAERLQQMLFSDSPFMRDFLAQRKFTDLTLTAWSGENKCRQSRVLSYTIPVTNPLGPKAAAVIETQNLFRPGPQSGACAVDSEVITQGIPYQDYFYTTHRYCISALAHSRARLRVSSEIRYRKQPWTLVKALIEKNAWGGVEEYFQHLELALAQAEKALLEESGCGKEPRGLRRRKRALAWRPPHHTEAPGAGAQGGPRTMHPSGSLSARLTEQVLERGPGHSVSTIILVISLVLVVLVVLNMLLFYRLWALEQAARTVEAWQAYALAKGKLPQTAAEWAEVLELQRRFQRVEVQKWRQILRASVELLDEVLGDGGPSLDAWALSSPREMKLSLEKLQQGIARAEPELEPQQDSTFS